jgi:class 3 adenylate cyclase
MGGEALPRGTVTFLFSDIEGSTDLVRRVGDDLFASIRAEHRQLLRDSFAAQGGREIDTAGDGFFVAFDSARKGVAAAVDAQLALAAARWPADSEVLVRMGLHTAEPHLSADGYVGFGVTRASRICDAARGGQILVSNATAGIIEDAELPGIELVDLGEHRLKGLPREQRLFQLAGPGLRSGFGPPRTHEAQTSGDGTFLFADLVGWRHVIRALGDEASAALADDYHAAVASAVAVHEGVVIERSGDHLWAVFRSAGAAIRGAVSIREVLSDFAWPSECDIALSMVLHSGRWSGDPRRPDAGTAFYRLSRFAQIVDPGQVLVSQATAALIEGDRDAPALRSLGERTLPDSDEPMDFYELVERQQSPD